MRTSIFLISALALGSCATGPNSPSNAEVEIVVSVHDKGEWYDYRAAGLGLARDEAMERDRGFDGDNPPPPEFWDEQVAVESATIWRLMCNECHKGKRRIATAREIPPPEGKWGHESGNFFGRQRPYRDMHLQISIGGAAKPEINSRMPGFAEELSNEQIWGLIYFVEYASKVVSR